MPLKTARMVRRRRTASVRATHKGRTSPELERISFKGLGEMVPVRAPLSQRGRNIRAKQAPRAPGQVRARELMRTPKFRPVGGAKTLAVASVQSQSSKTGVATS